MPARAALSHLYPLVSRNRRTTALPHHLPHDLRSSPRFGNVTQRRLHDGQLISSTYDNRNRATIKDLPAPESDVTYAYDLQGRLLSAVQGTQTSAMAYDALGRMTSEASGG